MSTWHDALTGEGFRGWLLQVARGDRISQGQPLDPFITSMRVLKQVTSWLVSVEELGQLDSEGRRAEQALVDMVAAELVVRQQDSIALTDLGHDVLRKWQENDIANDDDDDELPRCLALVQGAMRLRIPKYLRMLDFWREIRHLYEVDQLFSTPEALYSLSYFNQSANGYNPWHVIRSVSVEHLDAGTLDWQQLKAGVAPTNTAVSNAIDNLSRRVRDYATRATGRINFCRAMELYVLEPALALQAIDTWALEERTRERCRGLLPSAITEDLTDLPLRYLAIADDDHIWLQVRDLLELGCRNILFEGPPGTSKTTYALSIGARLAEGDRSRFHNMQFHQSLSYDDFVQGYVPTETAAGFKLRNKVFLNVCREARRDPPHVFHVLVLDELNRADPSRVIGEAFTYIERRDEAFRLSYSDQICIVPSNLVILATLNPFDKSIADLDQALDRRFEKIEMQPDPTILRSILTEQNHMEPQLAGQLIGFFNFLTGEVKDRIGHAYFKDVKDTDTLELVWKHQILPLLKKELRYSPDQLEAIMERYRETFPPTSGSAERPDSVSG